MRQVGCHYHIFRVRNHGAARAFSSHQIRLPVPVSLEVRVLPVVFLRHPLLRIRSVYEFLSERSGQGEGLRRLLPGPGQPGFTSRDEASANGLTFAAWLQEVIEGARPLNNISNAQIQLLGGELYARLETVNQQDLQLYREVCERLD